MKKQKKQKRYHSIIDVSGVEHSMLTNARSLKIFLTHLTRTIGMHVLKGPMVAHGIPENPGLSGIVIIDFSHISIHTFTDTHEALVDIFSCKPYDKKIALAEVLLYFRVLKKNAKRKIVSWG